MSESSMMNAAYLPALAALAGSAIGGLTSLASAWLTQKHQDRAKRNLQDKGRRQKLYGRFIDEASKLYADALAHDEAEVAALVSVYALITAVPCSRAAVRSRLSRSPAGAARQLRCACPNPFAR